MRLAITILILLSLALIAIMGLGIYQFLHSRPDLSGSEKVINIPRGASLSKIAQILESEGVITDRHKFLIVAKFYAAEHPLKAGEYQLNTSMLPLDVLDTLKKGRVLFYTVTIPEGYTLKQIAELLANLHLVDGKRFLELASDANMIKTFGVEANTLEGYLFPDTYYLDKTMSEEAILKKMVSRFWEIFDGSMQNRVKELGFSPHQVVTLASMIEKETGAEEERQLVSAVFHNRLKRRELLQSDPTVIYAIKEFNGNLTREDLKLDSPYNTYRYPGLPPGPIANPGKASLLAALYPADVDYRYFVSKNDGTHEFSSSLKQHNAAVKKYQLNGGTKNKEKSSEKSEDGKIPESKR